MWRHYAKPSEHVIYAEPSNSKDPLDISPQERCDTEAFCRAQCAHCCRAITQPSKDPLMPA
eukprot:1158283-Pelagomonas_calceolata.AAC.3